MTLIEFMVGITVGLLVVLAAVDSIVMIRDSAHTMTDSAALDQQAWLVMAQIGQQITQAGAINAYASGTDPDAGIDGVRVATVTSSAKVQFDTRNAGVNQNPSVSVFGQAGNAASPDQFTISYAQPNDNGGAPAHNCIGTSADTLPNGAPRVVNIFSVNTTDHSLLCGSGKPKSSPQPIAGNVVDLRVTYLLVNNGNVTYNTTAQIAAANNWAQVAAIQVCLEMQGDPTQAPEQKIEKDCQNNPRDITDGRIHHIVRQTFYLRNAN